MEVAGRIGALDGPRDERPVGIVAAALALAIAFAVGGLGRVYATRETRRLARATAAAGGATKTQTLILQRAAFANRNLLPIYGSSELYCCGNPYLPTQLFPTRGGGFVPFAIGRPGVGNLIFAETFGALGHAITGKKVVIIDSPPWFSEGEPADEHSYVGNFSPGIARTFVFEAPISRGLRRAAALRMLDHPETLEGDTLLDLGLQAIAQPTRLHRLAYGAIAPLGHLEVWLGESSEAWRTLFYVWRMAKQRGGTVSPAARQGWDALATRATAIEQQRDTTNPFGFPDDKYKRMRRDQWVARKLDAALGVYWSGTTNRDGRLYPEVSAKWMGKVAQSTEWTDMRLMAAVLRELGARAFIWTLPMPGYYDDYTALGEPVRRTYYEHWERVVGTTGFPWLDFRADDEDPYFLTDMGGHLSPRGWVFADRAMAMFWHEHPIGEIRDALATMAVHVPAPAAVVASEGSRR